MRGYLLSLNTTAGSGELSDHPHVNHMSGRDLERLSGASVLTMRTYPAAPQLHLGCSDSYLLTVVLLPIVGMFIGGDFGLPIGLVSVVF